MTQRPILRIETDLRPDEHTQIITLSGKLVGEPIAYALLEDTRERVKEGMHRIVLVMDRVEMINSSGAGILASMYMSASGQGGKVLLAGLSERSRKVLELMRMHEFMAMVDDLDAALAD